MCLSPHSSNDKKNQVYTDGKKNNIIKAITDDKKSQMMEYAGVFTYCSLAKHKNKHEDFLSQVLDLVLFSGINVIQSKTSKFSRNNNPIFSYYQSISVSNASL
jgi:hypothetical protein